MGPAVTGQDLDVYVTTTAGGPAVVTVSDARLKARTELGHRPRPAVDGPASGS